MTIDRDAMKAMQADAVALAKRWVAAHGGKVAEEDAAGFYLRPPQLGLPEDSLPPGMFVHVRLTLGKD